MAVQQPQRVAQLRAVLVERFAEFHLGTKPFGHSGETVTQTVARWRKGYCSAAMANSGFMAPWTSPSDPVASSHYVRRGVEFVSPGGAPSRS